MFKICQILKKVKLNCKLKIYITLLYTLHISIKQNHPFVRNFHFNVTIGHVLSIHILILLFNGLKIYPVVLLAIHWLSDRENYPEYYEILKKSIYLVTLIKEKYSLTLKNKPQFFYICSN